MADITPINASGQPDEDPLENLLDEESDDDFGYVVTRDRANGPDGHPVKLAEWSAQDFASIYTRFRPHLERHARRFLTNQGQVDEVVQDAFLYLMVSLPELDSEIGVLRFLKWKTRLLCLDVIRASGKAYVANLDDVAEPISSDPEVSSYLEQQDDAAVLRLALSKLTPRHREVLLASIYEEKSATEIAVQVGLSENATRQLIFRARSAFKKALLGDDVNTQGMSAAAILSVAARKAAMEAKKVGAQAMVFVLFMMLAVGAFVNITGRGTQTQQSAQAPAESQAPTGPAPEASVSPTESGDSVQILANPPISLNSAPGILKPGIPERANPESLKVIASDALLEFATTAASLEEISSKVTKSTYLAADKREVLEVAGDPLTANFEYLTDERVVASLMLTFMVEGETYRLYPYNFKSVGTSSGSVVVNGQLGFFIDSKSRIIIDNPLQSAQFQLVLQIDGLGRVASADLKLIK